jgi:hypothetical protein
MGSISTFLVHKSPVPVSVIRKPAKKKEEKASKKSKKVKAPPLSESKFGIGISDRKRIKQLTVFYLFILLGVKTGALAVDEFSQQKQKS